MPTSHKTSASASSVPDDQQWQESQLLKNRGRTNSSPLSRAVFYNPNEKTTQVRRGKNIDFGSYQKLKIPAKTRLVTIFVDPETESKPTTKSAQDGRSNVVLTQLHLDQLSPYGKILRCAGLLSTCYVMNAPPLSAVSSQTNLQGVAS